ncbi:MAG: hypothetical protein AAGA66_00530 [Bacteroidota bacterium]
MKTSLFVITLAILLSSCRDQQGSSENDPSTFAYKLYEMEKMGWKSQKSVHSIQGTSYRAIQVPLQYYLLKNAPNLSPDSLSSIYEAYQNERIIEVEFESARKDDLLKANYTRMDYEEGVKYLAFTIQEDFYAVTSAGDTVNCSGVIFERNYQLAPFKRLLLHFGGIPEGERIQLVYQDRLFGNGILKFQFDELPIIL